MQQKILYRGIEKNDDFDTYQKEVIKDLENRFRFLLRYKDKAKEYNVDLTEKDGLDSDIVCFLNHKKDDIHLTKDNLFEEIAHLFEYKQEDLSIFNDPVDSSKIVHKNHIIYELTNAFAGFGGYEDSSYFKNGNIPKIYMAWIKSKDKDLRGYHFPQIAGSSIFLDEALDIENVVFPVMVLNGLYMNNVRKATNAVLPKVIFGGGLLMDNLESAVSVTWPVFVEGGFSLGYLKSAEGLPVPKYIIDGNLTLGMPTVEYLKLSEYVGGFVEMPELVYAKCLELPLYAEAVFFENLENVDGLVIPEPLTYEIHCKGFTITPENVHLYRNNQITLRRELYSKNA